MEPVADTIALRVPRRSELRRLWVAYSLLMIGSAALVISGLVLLGESRGAAAILAGGGLTLAAATEYLRRSSVADLEVGTLSVRNGWLVLDHWPLFRRPMGVELSQLRAVAVHGTSETIEAGVGRKRHDQVRFPVHFAGSEPGEVIPGRPGTVATSLRAEGIPARAIGRERCLPNVVLLFDAPIPVPPLRRSPEHGPQRREALAALGIEAEDPQAIADLLTSNGVRMRIDEDDVVKLREIERGTVKPAGLRRREWVSRHQADARRSMLLGAAFALLGFFLPFLELLALPMIRRGWAVGERLEAAALATITAAAIGFHLFLLAEWEVNPLWFVGPLALVGFIGFQAARARRDGAAGPSAQPRATARIPN